MDTYTWNIMRKTHASLGFIFIAHVNNLICRRLRRRSTVFAIVTD